jgi:hypothetical protein
VLGVDGAVVSKSVIGQRNDAFKACIG